VILEETGSTHNPVLQVLLYKERFQLCTRTAIYSYEDKYDNFRTAFDLLKIRDKHVKSTLLLGLGLGSIPQMLETIYKVDSDYTAVEIDEVICQLAEKYVLSDLKSNIQTYPIDALDYFKWYDHTFDLIAMDIFQSAVVPEEFESIEYFNTMEWKSIFPKGGIIDCKNNLIFINDLRHIPK